jgi:hypothetical protein
MPIRVPVVAVLVALGVTVGAVALPVSRHAVGEQRMLDRTPTVAAPTLVPGHSAPADVLRGWDRRRAAVWADGDARALRALYTPRSAAGSADVALLRRYAARGLVVHGLRMQLLAVRVLVQRPRRLELEVTDRVARAVAVRATDSAVSRLLPTDTASTRVLVLRLVGERWLVERVSSAGR